MTSHKLAGAKTCFVPSNVVQTGRIQELLRGTILKEIANLTISTLLILASQINIRSTDKISTSLV